jgi:DNA primase
MFPIFNLSGRVIAFGGRILPGHEGPKYINTPESPLYQKSRVLYGFNFGRIPIDQSGEAVLVEGYMDLVSLWQAGVKNAVAVCGTALTREHVQTLSRFAKKAFLFFDGDAAGRNAVRRSLEPLVAQGVEVRVPVLPDGEDPDSFAHSHSAGAFAELFASAEDAPGFLIRSVGKAPEALSPEEKDALVREAVDLFRHAPSPTVREGHVQNMRKRLGLRSNPALSPRGPRLADTASPATSRVPGLFAPGSVPQVREEAVAEWQLLQLVLAYPDWTQGLIESLDLGWFSDERARDLVDHTLALLAEGGGLNLRTLADRLPEALRDSLSALEISEGDSPERVRRIAGDCAQAVEMRHLRRELAGAEDPARHMELHKQIQALNTRKGGTP